MTDIFIESMLCEQTQLLDTINAKIEEAKIGLLESIGPDPFFEAGSASATKSDGIFQAIVRLLKTIINAIGDGFKKIGTWITGAKITPEGQNARIQGMDPNAVVKLVNGDIADASDALKKAASGKMTIEEAKAFIDKKESVWKTLKSSMIPVVGLSAFFLGKKFTVDQWKAEANAAMDEVEKLNRSEDSSGSDSKLASKIAHQYGDQAKKDAAKDASQLIVNHMNQTVRRGLGLLMTPLREAFQKGYLEKELMNEAQLMGTKEGRRKLREENQEKLSATRKATRAVDKLRKNLTKASDEGNRAIDKRMAAEDDLARAKRQTFDNLN